jgi:N,N'-diacetylbacillosaminyl-diphospho-undecaprenol alpha-1,3-N-acetylgalactosaminyltransferase
MDRFSAGSHVRFLGKRQDIREILAATDVYALPSYREGTPRTVLEAMAMGKPVITTDAPGCRQTVEDGVTGLLVPVGDHAAVAAALERLIGDEQLRRRMGAAGRERAARIFSDEVVVREVVRLHES